MKVQFAIMNLARGTCHKWVGELSVSICVLNDEKILFVFLTGRAVCCSIL